MFNINEQLRLAMKNYMQANETEKTAETDAASPENEEKSNDEE